ncbi:hypothetical protein AB6A40_001474 [Gnathostoma spinigerum]|uniref:28S ribosomal protein S22, mitochondrial n=1 Tax=Gnathostoma spinigerum TaxID=75299 RepID=A0ABD6E493_9BILA
MLDVFEEAPHGFAQPWTTNWTQMWKTQWMWKNSFTNAHVQSLLKDLTGLDLAGKIFAHRKVEKRERSQYALMTNEMYEETLNKLSEEARHFLQFVPVKEPRKRTYEVLAEDSEIAMFDDSKFVFTDITFDATNQDRTVVVREPNGVLRTATYEEHDRMNRLFYEQPSRPVFPPPVFSDPYLQKALDENKHEFVLDWACYFYEPDDPDFVSLSRTIFDRTVADEKFDNIYSTRHFGAFAFYLALNGKIPPLLNYFGRKGDLTRAAKLIRLEKIVHPNWRLAIGSDDDDAKIVGDYLKQNQRYRSLLRDIAKLLQHKDTVTGKDVKEIPKSIHTPSEETDLNRHLSVEGPLGEMAPEYPVRLVRSSYERSPSESTPSAAKLRRRRQKGPSKKTLSKGDPTDKPLEKS